MYLTFICDLPHECAGFFAIAQNDMSRAFFVILNKLLGRGRISTVSAGFGVVIILSFFICDSSREYAGFFAIAQNDLSRAFFVILNKLLGRGRIHAEG